MSKCCKLLTFAHSPHTFFLQYYLESFADDTGPLQSKPKCVGLFLSSKENYDLYFEEKVQATEMQYTV